MANKNYVAGARLERERLNFYKKHGYMGARSAGSHSPFDLIVYNTDEVIAIQCKRTTSKSEAKRLALMFTNNPPLGKLCRSLKQRMEIKIKGSTDIITVNV